MSFNEFKSDNAKASIDCRVLGENCNVVSLVRLANEDDLSKAKLFPKVDA